MLVVDEIFATDTSSDNENNEGWYPGKLCEPEGQEKVKSVLASKNTNTYQLGTLIPPKDTYPVG